MVFQSHLINPESIKDLLSGLSQGGQILPAPTKGRLYCQNVKFRQVKNEGNFVFEEIELLLGVNATIQRTQCSRTRKQASSRAIVTITGLKIHRILRSDTSVFGPNSHPPPLSPIQLETD